MRGFKCSYINRCQQRLHFLHHTAVFVKQYLNIKIRLLKFWKIGDFFFKLPFSVSTYTKFTYNRLDLSFSIPKVTVRMRSRSIQPIYVVSLFCICSIQNTDKIHFKRLVMSSMLEKWLEYCCEYCCQTDDINRLNRVRSHTDGEGLFKIPIISTYAEILYISCC